MNRPPAEAAPERTPAGPHSAAFHITAKPTGAICNLDCRYCFYLSKQMLYPGGRFRMSDEVLESYVRQLLEAHRRDDVTIAWQGGEPTLMGREFFERAVSHAERYRAPGQRVSYSIQTNAVLIDRTWAKFFASHDFLVGVSLDGPRALHDAYRVDKQGGPTFGRVMRGVEALKSAGVRWNVLATLHSANAAYPREIYRFLRDRVGARYLQFIPIVERETAVAPVGDGCPAGSVRTGTVQARPFYAQRGERVGDCSITPGAYGRFMIQVFDEWVRRDVGRVYVQDFDVALAAWCGLPSALCIFAPTCGSALALEHNGDLYACDHFVEPGYRLGNILREPLRSLVDSEPQRRFGRDKLATLPDDCNSCEFRFACHGGCPKDRFVPTGAGGPPKNYLCDGYKAFFAHIDEPMRMMRDLVCDGHPAAEVMKRFAIRPQRVR